MDIADEAVALRLVCLRISDYLAVSATTQTLITHNLNHQ